MRKRLNVSLALVIALSFGIAPSPQAQASARIEVQSVIPATVPVTGQSLPELAAAVAAISAGDVELVIHAPGALVPPLEVYNAVENGSIDASLAPASFWARTLPAAQVFAGLPFGPAPVELLAWLRHGGGAEIWQEVIADRGLHAIICGITTAEAGGWFREEIKTLDDLNGLRMRFLGLGAEVMEEFGVSTQLLAPTDIFTALQLGSIDATEFSQPAIDLSFGFYQIAQHYYLPGWHQPSTLVYFIISKTKWQSLSAAQQSQLDVACDAQIQRDIAAGEAAQFAALEQLQAKGVTLHRWPNEFLAAFEEAWLNVVQRHVANDADFAKAWKSLSMFRARYALWQEMGYLK